MRRRVLLFLLPVVLILAGGCTSGGAPAQNDSAVDTLGNVLNWDSSPQAVIVRLDTQGRTGDPVTDLNMIPFCTIFGDGHVIWTDPFSSPEQVLEDRIDDQTFREFLQYIIGSGFYSWTSEGFIPPTNPAGPSPVVETITLTLYGETRMLDAFSNWPPETFERILERCRTLSSTPVTYLPQGVWLSTVEEPVLNDIPSLPWDAYAETYTTLDFASATLENPQWQTGELASLLWRLARQGRMQITEGETAYRLIVQDPVLQPDAPPAPAGAPTSEPAPAT